jgi:hypothetical protein
VVSVLWFVISGARKQKTKRIVYGRRVLKEGMTEALKEGARFDREGQKKATETRKQRGFVKRAKKRCAKGTRAGKVERNKE